MWILLSLAAGVLSAPSIEAQTPAPPGFEVASVKSCTLDSPVPKGRGGGGTSGGPGSSPGRFLTPCDTLLDLIRTAYGESIPIEGGPGWITSDRYQITAKAEDHASPAIMSGPMLQALLEDRFQLKIRRETREVPVYALTVSKGGFKLQPAKEGSCLPPDEIGAHLEPGQKPCGIPMTRVKGSNMNTEILGRVDQFCKVLGRTLGRPVIDRTGITGLFDFHLEFALDDTMPGAGRRGPAPATPDDPPGPSIFAAVQQQLGLKLESSKGSGEVLVIDRVSRPSAN